ncbi:uncharacterized protein [Prorops nasuta]|uniref:uncharacterized protein n=1 Tax=Prorops nasuta TaxID=863751 RepID=UPI0034CDCCEA
MLISRPELSDADGVCVGGDEENLRESILGILLFVIGEPLLSHAKVVIVVPQQVRRSPSVPYYRKPSNFHKKSLNGNHEYHRHTYQHLHYAHPNALPARESIVPFPSPTALVAPAKSPYPQGGDDFDQDHDNQEVNHVMIPYGKDVTHGISFGKGYIPYDTIKGTFSAGHEKYPFNLGHKQPDFAATYTSSSSNYGQPIPVEYHQDVLDNYSYDVEPYDHDGDFGTRKSGRKKFYTSRSLEKDLGTKSYRGFGNLLTDKETLSKEVNDLIKESGDQTRTVPVEGSILLPSGGVPSATIGGNKDGIVLKDSIILDEYHKTIENLMKSWPSTMINPAAIGFSQGQHLQTIQVPEFQQQIQSQALVAPQTQTHAQLVIPHTQSLMAQHQQTLLAPQAQALIAPQMQALMSPQSTADSQISHELLRAIQARQFQLPRIASRVSWVPEGQGYAVKEDIPETFPFRPVSSILSKSIPPVPPQSGLPSIQSFKSSTPQFSSSNIQTVPAPSLAPKTQ